MGVEQLALGIPAQQRMMGVLAVDVGEEIGDLAQLPEGRRRHR
jgi:cell division ATPase FtsA